MWLLMVVLMLFLKQAICASAGAGTVEEANIGADASC